MHVSFAPAVARGKLIIERKKLKKNFVTLSPIGRELFNPINIRQKPRLIRMNYESSESRFFLSQSKLRIVFFNSNYSIISLD